MVGEAGTFVGRLDWVYYVIEELSRHRMRKKTVVATKSLDHSVFPSAQTCSLQWLTRMVCSLLTTKAVIFPTSTVFPVGDLSSYCQVLFCIASS